MLSGERGIRTPGASLHDGFQDRCNRPLYHLSKKKTDVNIRASVEKRCKGSSLFRHYQIFASLFDFLFEETAIYT